MQIYFEQKVQKGTVLPQFYIFCAVAIIVFVKKLVCNYLFRETIDLIASSVLPQKVFIECSCAILT